MKTKHLLFRNYIITSSVLLNRKILGKNPFNYTVYKNTSEDYDLWLRLSLNYKIGYIGKCLIKYRVHSSLTSRSDNLPKLYRNSIYLINKYLKNVSGIDKNIGTYSKNQIRFSYIKLLLSNNNFFGAFTNVLKIMWDLKYFGFVKLLIYRFIYPRKSFEELFLECFKNNEYSIRLD